MSTVFTMFSNTAYPTPSGYDARKRVKTLKPLVYMMLSTFLAILLKLRNLSHFKFVSAERKQKIVGIGGWRELSFPEKNTRMSFLVFVLFGYYLFRMYFHLYLKVIWCPSSDESFFKKNIIPSSTF